MILNEKYINKAVCDAVNTVLLNESQESKSIDAAKKLVINKLGYTPEQADNFIRQNLRQDLPVLRSKQGAKFILGVTRMFVDGQLTDANIINRLNTTLKYVASDAHINEYDRNLNNMSAQDLIQRFAKNVETDLDNDKNEINSMQFQGDTGYDIVRIDSFEEANQYEDYTEWCVTHDEYMFDSYTAEGLNQFYFCLKKGFVDIPKKQGEGCPLDDYGLSMLAVCVNGNGALQTCTCRWNHSNGGDDNILNTKQISELVGKNFYEVFKPNTMWKDTLNNVMQRIKNGENFENIFDRIGDFHKGYARIKLKNRWNLIDQQGNIVSPDRWFEYVSDLVSGFFLVQEGDLNNYMDTNGKILSKEWFNICQAFDRVLAKVQINGKGWNYIKRNGELVSPNLWFNNTKHLTCGYYVGYDKDGKTHYINYMNGELLSDNEFYGFINKFLSDGIRPDHIFDDVKAIVNTERYANVSLGDERHNILDLKTKQLLSPNVWFDKVGYALFDKKFIHVQIGRQTNYIDTDGEILSPNLWFDSVDYFREGFAAVSLNNEENFIDTKGNLLSPYKWFSSVLDFRDGFTKVYMDNKRYYLDRNGDLLDYETREKITNVNDLKESRKPKMIVTESQLRELIKWELKKLKK